MMSDESNSTIQTDDPSPKKRSRKGWLRVAVALVALAVFYGVYRYVDRQRQQGEAEKKTTDQSDNSESPANDEPPTDDELADQLLGQWKTQRQGELIMTLHDDGTGMMVHNGRLQFDIEWEVADGRLKTHTVGGKPWLVIKGILATMGDRSDEAIDRLEVDTLVLEEKDGTLREWSRVD